MKWQHSAGLVPFFEKHKERKYLLLLSALTKNELWEFPKGHIEKGESAETAASREFEEESGIHDFEVLPGFKKVLKYFYRSDDELIGKTVTYFLARTRNDRVSISEESKDFRWMNYEQTLQRIKHKNLRKLLVEAEEHLNTSS